MNIRGIDHSFWPKPTKTNLHVVASKVKDDFTKQHAW